MQDVYLIVGVSGSGKSWVARQLADKFNYVPHDRCWTHPHAKPAEGLDPKWGPPGCKSTHFESLLAAAKESALPVLSEVPFAERKLREDLEKEHVHVVPVFVIEPPEVIAKRYRQREGKDLAKPALSRAISIVDRAKEWNSFFGTSDEVLKHLKELKFSDRMSHSEWRAFNRPK